MNTKGFKMLFSIIISMLLFLILLAIFLRIPICKGQIFSSARPWVLVFWPPSDLFEPLLVKDIDLLNSKQEQEYKFKIKYIGPYSISVLFGQFDEELYNKTYELNLKLKFDFCDEKGQCLITKYSDSSYSPFYGKIGNGLDLSLFEVPKEIPNGKIVKLKIKVIQIDKKIGKYGSSMICIQKSSEK